MEQPIATSHSVAKSAPPVNRLLTPGETSETAAALLAEGYSISLKALGSSMSPFIRDGETVLIEPSPSQYRKGDIVFFRRSTARNVIHRVLRIENHDGNTTLVTQGDAAMTLSETVAPEEVLGKVVSVERGGREVDLNSPWLRILAGAWRALQPVRYLVAGIQKRVRLV